MKTNLLQKNIPKGWNQMELGDIADITMGQSPSSSFYNQDGNGLPFFQGKADFDKSAGVKIRQWTSSVTKTSDVGDILLSVRAPVGDIALNNTKACIGRGLASLRAKEDVTDQGFLFQLMMSLKSDLNKKSQGSTFKAINGPALKKINTIIPPTKEQKKIAEILSSVDEEIQKVDQIITLSEKLKDGLVRDLFDFKNKKDIKLMTLGEIGKASMCKRIFKDQTSNTGDIPFYKIGTFGKNADAFISQELFDIYREKFSFPKVGDVLLSASGTIGRKVKYDGEPAYFQDSNIIWLEHDESKVLNDFLFYLYETIKWETSGSTIKRLYNNAFIKKVVPVPPIDTQRKIVDVLLAIDQKILVNSNLKEKLMMLKKGLMSDLLSGQVRTI